MSLRLFALLALLVVVAVLALAPGAAGAPDMDWSGDSIDLASQYQDALAMQRERERLYACALNRKALNYACGSQDLPCPEL